MSHREALNGSILNDISYFSTIEVRGSESLVKQVLQNICDPSDISPSSKRYACIFRGSPVLIDLRGYSTGARACETNLYHFSAYPFRLIGPVTVMWTPLGFLDNPSASSQSTLDASLRRPPPKRILTVRL